MIDMSMSMFMAKAMPILKTLLWVGGGVIALIVMAYYLFVVKQRRKWFVNVWEQKANGKLYLVGNDVLVEKRFNKGKQTAFWLKKQRRETLPPPEECVDRRGKKEIANYLRILEDYIPLERTISIPEEQQSFVKKVKENVAMIAKMGRGEIDERYIHVPLNAAIMGKLNFTPIEYDVNMMRINALDNRDKIYQDVQDWMQKYGHLVAIGMIVVLIIVVLYLSYDYSSNVINGAGNSVASALDKVADKMGVSPPS